MAPLCCRLQRCRKMAEEPEGLLAELSRLREQLEQSQQERGCCRELLRCLQEEKQELQDAAQELARENCALRQRGCSSHQELQGLEELLPQLEERLQAAKGERGRRLQELDKEKERSAQLKEQLREQEARAKVLRAATRQLREEVDELELENAYKQQTEQEPEAEGSVLPELLEAQLEREELAKRCGIATWLPRLCVLFMCLELVVGLVLGAVVLYASRHDQELLFRLLLWLLPEETYARLAYLLGESLSLRSEGLLPF
ncbi:golgin subfamily A member 6-like protein 10 [Dromaius novaehollandiae]|uniref:golgin subfamily A member 6-like protein 10 n=1 Tax=Dromaius novaehollandiae TaxID=8790 RepID=UPI00311F128E